MYGGDEVNAVVVDVGSSTVKAGYAGEDAPKAVFPSWAGVISSRAENGNASEATPMEGVSGAGAGKSAREIYAGAQAVGYRRDHMEVVPALRKGLYDDWEVMEALWKHTFSDRLRIETREHPLMLAEPSFQPRELREKLVETMFETFAPPALFLAKNAVLSSFAMGRQTSLVLDCGYEGTTASVVHDGFLLQKSVARSPIGGRLLSHCMLQSVQSKGITIQPSYCFKRTEKPLGSGHFELEMLDQPHTTDSFRQYHVEQIAADIKESICRVSDTPFSAEANANIPTVDYELPDGNEIQVGPDRFNVPEVLFQPRLLSAFAGAEAAAQAADLGEPSSLQALVLKSIGRCDVDVRRDLYGGVIVTGGSSLFPQFRERLERELTEVAPQAAKVKVMLPTNTIERRFSVWIGGSILASLGSFQQMWMSKGEYEEHGASLIHRRAP